MPLRRAIVSLLVAALPLRAAELPELGEAARAGLTQAQEAQLGREIMRQVRANRDYLDDPELTEYLNDLGDRLAAVSPAPYRQFSFFAVRDPTINAFALPGGHIGVHTGLISAVRSESELAAVLAHEIAHVTQNHVARMLEAQKSASLASLVALAIAILAARTDSQVSQAAATVGSALTVQQQLDYSRDFEREADRVGLNILTQAGFAPQAMVSFFERLQAQSRVLETHAPAYLRTHPLTYQRIADLQNRVGELPYRQYPDSLEFRLIQAKVWAGEGEPGQALARLESRLAQDARDAASWYGLARAALRAGNLVRAAEAVRRLDGLGVNSPMIDILAMDLAVAQGQAEQAIARGRQALARHSTSRPLVYAYARGLLLGGRAAEALRLVEEQLRTWPEDARLYALKARAHGELGQRFDAHLAQAEASYRQGELAPAIEQLQLALSSGERDFHKLSIAEARLRALRALQQGESGPPRR